MIFSACYIRQLSSACRKITGQMAGMIEHEINTDLKKESHSVTAWSSGAAKRVLARSTSGNFGQEKAVSGGEAMNEDG